MCVFAWVSVSMHAWAILSGEWGGWRRQGSQSEGPGLSQLISSRARPQTGQQQPPGQQSSCESAGGENVSLTLQIESFKELIWGCLASPYLIWPQLIRLLLHYVSSGAECGIGSCVCVCARACSSMHLKALLCVCWNLVIMLNAWIGCRPGQCEVIIVCNTVKLVGVRGGGCISNQPQVISLLRSNLKSFKCTFCAVIYEVIYGKVTEASSVAWAGYAQECVFV